MKISIKDEFSTLKAVVLGTGQSMGLTPDLETAIDPKSKEHVKAGTYPVEQDVVKEMDQFCAVLEKHNVEVYRPTPIDHYDQIFTRDIGCVIEDTFIITNMISERSQEIEALQHVLDQISSDKIVRMQGDARLEGGDIMPVKDHIFIGYSEEEDFKTFKTSRTNRAGIDFIQNLFPHLKVKGFELNKSDTEPRDNALHLDCCFQPIGNDQCILYKGGFKNVEDYEFIKSFFGSNKCIEIDRDQMYEMASNIFSISPTVIVSDRAFVKLNQELLKRGFEVEEIHYREIAKMEGLLRCSTLPLLRV